MASTLPGGPTIDRDSRAQRHSEAILSLSHTRREGSSDQASEKDTLPPEKWTMGILNDKRTEEVPGTVLLLSSNRNEPLGMQHQHDRASQSSMPSQDLERRMSNVSTKKRTADGEIILVPQPDDSLNDPLNWSSLRRDCALLSLGFYCMVGGGMTPILAAGYNNVVETYNVSYSRVALTTGLYMMGLGVGSVIASPTAILFGKRPVYLLSALTFVLTSVWCALAPSYVQLVIARVLMGISVSPVECLPSATIAEIFFLHERAFRIGIYTLLLLGGKNLVPLVSAVIIQAKGWRWVFWIVAIVVGFAGILLWLFVPETFWDRTPRPKSRRPSSARRTLSNLVHHSLHHANTQLDMDKEDDKHEGAPIEKTMSPRQQKLHQQNVHARFEQEEEIDSFERALTTSFKPTDLTIPTNPFFEDETGNVRHQADVAENTPHLHNMNSPFYSELEKNDGYFDHLPVVSLDTDQTQNGPEQISRTNPNTLLHPTPNTEIDRPPLALTLPKTLLDEQARTRGESTSENRTLSRGDLDHTSRENKFKSPQLVRYTTNLRRSPPQSYLQTLKPWNGRLSNAKWIHVLVRPFILYAYPAVLWSALVYSLSIGWLIVLSEAVSNIYRNRDTYNFSALGTGLAYLSPFIGGILGTAVAGKVSDVIVRFMARRNGGVYEPEFRLVMAAPIGLCTAIGLMGFGWSAQERDHWIVPTIFFGVISFGCSLGSTTAITFCVDSYRQYAGEALVTLNFSKNIFHGLVFSLFFPGWLEDDGPRTVFLAIGGIQIACLLTSIPMYIYGKRGRMWTVRQGFMEKF